MLLEATEAGDVQVPSFKKSVKFPKYRQNNSPIGYGVAVSINSVSIDRLASYDLDQ